MGFFKSFMGIDQQNDINDAYNTGTQQLKKGFADQQRSYRQAGAMFDPYINQGTRANTSYNDMLGINGIDAQKEAYGMITSNPLYQNSLDQQNNAMMRYLNARGNLGGAADIAAQRVFQENMGNWMNRYRDAGAEGLRATTYGANIKTGMGDNSMGMAATQANMTMGRGNALASNRNTGVNNIMGAVGALTGGWNAFNNMQYNNVLKKKYDV